MTQKTVILNILNESFPGVKELYSVRDEEAVSAFASFFRSYLDSTSERFFSIPYEKPENIYKLPAESDKEAADRISSGTLISVGIPSVFGSVNSVDWHSNPTYNGYKEWTWQLSRHNDIKHLAHEYRLTGDKKYAEAASALLSSWIDTCPPPAADVPGDATDTWRTIECGIRMGANWPYFIYSFYKDFSDELLLKIAVSLNQHGERLQRNHMHGNWLLMEMNGLAHIAVLFPFLKKADEWRTFSINAMEEEAKKQFYKDGFQYELTTCYHEVAVNNYQRLLEMLQVFDTEMPSSLFSVIEKASEVNIALMEPDGALPDINDGSDSNVSELLKPKTRLFDNPLLLWGATEGKEGKAPDYDSIALPYSGFFVFRTGWKDYDLYALLDSAPFGRGHQHEDKLSLIVSNGRKRVITEGGCYAYDDSPMRKHTLSSFDHNVLIIDGMGQNRRKSYKWNDEDIDKLSDLKWKISESVDWAEGMYSGPYGDDESSPAVWRRSVYLVKKHPGLKQPVFIVVDRTESDAEHEYCYLWHCDSMRLSIARTSALYDDISVAFSEGGELSVTRGAMYPVGGYVATGKEQGMYKAVDRLEYRVTGKDKRVVTVFSFSDDLEAVRAGGNPDCADITLVVDGDEVILDEEELRS